jgi:hypothetical protein
MEETDRWTVGWMDRWTERWVDVQRESRYTDVQREKQIYRRTERKAYIQTYRETNRYTDVQRDKQIYTEVQIDWRIFIKTSR